MILINVSILSVLFVGVACALGGAALGATGLAGPPTSHLTAALLMIGKLTNGQFINPNKITDSTNSHNKPDFVSIKSLLSCVQSSNISISRRISAVYVALKYRIYLRRQLHTIDYYLNFDLMTA